MCRLLKLPTGGNKHQIVERGQDHCGGGQPSPARPPMQPKPRGPPPRDYKQLVPDPVSSGFKPRFTVKLWLRRRTVISRTRRLRKCNLYCLQTDIF